MNEPTKTKTEIREEQQIERTARSLASNENLRKECVRDFRRYKKDIVRMNEKHARQILSFYDQLRKLNNDVRQEKDSRAITEALERRLAILEQNLQPIKRIV